MSLYVNICSKLDPRAANKYKRVAINDLKTSVKTLIESVCDQLHLSQDQFDLMCFGSILVSDKSLDFYEITNGTTVWVINKTYLIKGDTPPTEPKPIIKSRVSQSEIQNMVIALKTALMNSGFRQMLDKLSEPEFRDNLIAVTPGLGEDATALAILQDPDLLSTLSEPTNIHKVLEKHPSLLDAATFLAATFHEETIANEAPGTSAALLSRSASGLDYSLDAMSSDEEMDSGEPPSDGQAQRIAEVMLRAYQNRGTSSQSNNSGVITQDMLRQALQQSQSSSQSSGSPSTSAPTTPTTSSAPTASSRLRQWATQLQQLRDLGINDDIIALQALEATSGDVQAAINIIFSDNNDQ